MNQTPSPSSEALLKLCVQSAPQPWRPSAFAKSTGADRDSLDEPLNKLRMAGLVRLTDWEPGVGQGYLPTELGTEAIGDSKRLSRLLSGSSSAPAVKPALAERSNRFTRGEAIRAAVYERHPAPVTRALIAIQVIVFAAGLYSALSDKTAKITLEQYLRSGLSPVTIEFLVSPDRLLRGEWWTLVTYALVHLGGLHLVMNLYAHWAIGPSVEGMLGSVRFLVLWLISALGGGFVVVLSRQGAGGSSGAICGLIGALAAFLALYHREIGRYAAASMRSWLSQTVLILVLISLMPGVSGAGHLGGGVFGFVAGGLLAVHRFGPSILRGPALIGVIAIPALTVGYLSESGILRLKSSVQEIAVQERASFTERLQPQVERVEELAQKIDDDQFQPLRDLRPEQREENNVRSAMTALAGLRTDQLRVLGAVSLTGRYQTPNVETARHAAEQLLKLRAESTALREECLRKGIHWKLESDEFGLQNRLNLALESEIAYRRALGGL